MQSKQSANNLPASRDSAQFSEEDLAKLYDYPSIGHLFSETDTRRLDEFCAQLRATRANLERVVRYGDRMDAERAGRAIRAVDVTLEFLQSLQKMRE